MHYRYRKPTVRGHLRALPRRGSFCVASEDNSGSGFRPLVCHSVFQEALEDRDVPDTQGINSRGNNRDVMCQGTRITGTKRVPYTRGDNKHVYEVGFCENRTKGVAWLGGQWTEVIDGLDGLRDILSHPLGSVAVGAAFAGLAALYTHFSRKGSY